MPTCRSLLYSHARHFTFLARRMAVPSPDMFLLLWNGLPLQGHLLLGGYCFCTVPECRANMAHHGVVQGPNAADPGRAGHLLGRNRNQKPMLFILSPEQTDMADVAGYPWTVVFVLHPFSSGHHLCQWWLPLSSLSRPELLTVWVDNRRCGNVSV